MKTIKTYHDNGQLKENYTIDENEKIQGIYKSWYRNGQLKIKANFKDDKEHGLWEERADNGQLKCRINYKNGQLIEK